ncbi:ATP-binding protein [Halomonas heilongjiangensis]|uniref:SARP family transcriptional regulator n=1 Tax=Halomonas heilongjiangensis TaxID=1387883 RepID=A0A2N7TKZ3_9GAMM|nr:AAA family ATPase [Halomonas heilongjiangensis]PMR68844.1 SARP family transcriptional regulator [Halomonas heilongjiangensis]PXX94555.1 SARP family transcriptional regulator [Halomonas heilongjiangensis]
MLEIRLLGEQQVIADGVSVEALRSLRTLGLLAYLVMHAGAPQPRQHVAGVFWPDSSEAQARTNLRRELHQLRAALPEPERYLAVGPRTLCWRDDAPCRIDLVAFRHAADEARVADDDSAFLAAAERAVRAYGGDLLPSCYDDWVLDARERLRGTCVDLLDRLAAALAEAGQLQAAMGHARRRVELEPLEESGYRALMALQARAGDRAAALHTGQRCAAVLERTLGVEPSSATVALYEALSTPAEPTLAVPPALRQAPPLIGRRAELATLEAAWARVAEGPRLVVIAGEAGVGKTRLAAELAHPIQHHGKVVAQARCFSSRARLALAPVAEWLRGVALRPGIERLEATWRAEVGRLVPARPAPLADAWQRRQFFEGLARAVLSAGTPTLLVLDDLQWCDRETLAWLELLLHLEPSAPLLLVATLRSEEFDDNLELVAACRRLQAQGALQTLELAPLSARQTARLAAALHDAPLDAAAARRLQARTGGFPLFVVESLRQGGTRPSRIEAILDGRLARLGPAAEELIGLAAALGRDFSLELLAAASDLDDTTLRDAVDELWQRRLLCEQSATTYDFAHDLLRDAAYRRLTPPHRRLLHRRIAIALERCHTDDRAAVAAQTAEQFERGGQPERAIHYHALAAEAATAVFALEDAVGHYDRALELLATQPDDATRARRELALCQAMVPPLVALHGYAVPRAGTMIERSVALGERLGETLARSCGESALCWHLFVQGRMHDAAALAERLATRPAGALDRAGWRLQALSLPLFGLGRHAEALDTFDRLEQEEVGDVNLFGFRAGVLIRGARAHAHWLVGQSAEAAATAESALRLAKETAHPFEETIAHAYAAITHHLLGDRERTDSHAATVRQLCARHGFAYYGEWGRILAGRLAGGAAGEALIRQGTERLQRQHAGTRMPFWLALLAEVLIETERADEASRVLAEARAWAEQHGDRWWLAELWRLDATLRDIPEAEARLERALAIATEQDALALQLRAAIDLARRWVAAGRLAEASHLLGPLRPRAAGCNPAELAAADALLTRLRP